MRSVINDNDGFKTIVEVKEVEHPPGYMLLQFSTEWEGARRDGSEQVKYRLLLSKSQIKNLKDLL